MLQAAVVLSERPDLDPEMTLLVDVGTNAEIVLGNNRRLVACSSPTGPAFEGAQISCGQRAAPGAIERVRIDRETLEPRFKVIGSDLWSNEPGFEQASSALGITGVCGSGIIEVIAEMYLAGILNQDGVLDGRLAARSNRIVENGRTFAYVLHRAAAGANAVEMRITQNDVRAIQLAKAALYAGVALLMDRLGIDHVDRIRLADALGGRIDVEHALVLGSAVLDCDPEGACDQPATAAGHWGANRAAGCDLARRDRVAGEAHREGRNRDRAAFSAPLRRGDGDSSQERAVHEPAQGARVAGAEGIDQPESDARPPSAAGGPAQNRLGRPVRAPRQRPAERFPVRRSSGTFAPSRLSDKIPRLTRYAE